jgi:hypothetical protein
MLGLMNCKPGLWKFEGSASREKLAFRRLLGRLQICAGQGFERVTLESAPLVYWKYVQNIGSILSRWWLNRAAACRAFHKTNVHHAVNPMEPSREVRWWVQKSAHGLHTMRLTAPAWISDISHRIFYLLFGCVF